MLGANTVKCKSSFLPYLPLGTLSPSLPQSKRPTGTWRLLADADFAKQIAGKREVESGERQGDRHTRR